MLDWHCRSPVQSVLDGKREDADISLVCSGCWLKLFFDPCGTSKEHYKFRCMWLLVCVTNKAESNDSLHGVIHRIDGLLGSVYNTTNSWKMLLTSIDYTKYNFL